MMAIAAEIQDDAIDDAAAVPPAEGSYLHGVNPGLTGFEAAPGLFREAATRA